MSVPTSLEPEAIVCRLHAPHRLPDSLTVPNPRRMSARL
jgi:hypothetical protein